MDATALTIGVGAFNTALSGFAIWLGWRKDRRKLSVVGLWAYDLDSNQPFLTVQVVNEGHRPITISQITLEYSKKTGLVSGGNGLKNTELPITIQDGEWAQNCFWEAVILSAGERQDIKQVVVTPVVWDASGRDTKEGELRCHPRSLYSDLDPRFLFVVCLRSVKVHDLPIVVPNNAGERI